MRRAAAGAIRPERLDRRKHALAVAVPGTERADGGLPHRQGEPVSDGSQEPAADVRIERSFGTAQDRLVKGLRVAGVRTLAEANRYLEEEFLP